MRWKWIALGGVVLVVVLVTSAYLVLSTYDYNRLKPRIERMVAEATGRELTLGGEVDLEFGLSPALVITDAALANASWASDPQMFTARKIKIKVRLLPLLSGDVKFKHLILSGVDVKLTKDAAGQGNWQFTRSGGAGGLSAVLNRMQIAVEDLRIENLKLTYLDEQTQHTIRLNLAGLEVARQAGPDYLSLTLQAHYNQQPVELSGRIGRLQRIIAGGRFPLDLAGKFASTTISIKGSIGEVRALDGIDLDIGVTGKNLQELGRDIGTELPRTDAFDLSGHLAGSGQTPMLQNISGNLKTGSATLIVSGRVGNLIALQDLDLQLRGSGKDLAQVGALVGQKLPSTDEVAVQGHLTGSLKALALQNIRGRARRGDLRLTAAGAIGDLAAFGSVDLQLKATGKDLAQAETLVGQKLPPTEAFELEGRLKGSGRMLSLQDIQAEARRGSLRLTAAGAIGDLLEFRRVDLRLKAVGKNLAQAETLVGQKLPPTDKFDLRGRLKGSGRVLSLQDVQAEARRGSLRLTAAGAIGALLEFRRVDLRLKAVGKNLAQAETLVGQKLPPTEAFELEGRLKGFGRVLSLQDIQAEARRGSLRLTAAGAIGDLVEFRRVDLRLKAVGRDLAEADAYVGQKLPPTDAFELGGRLTGSAGKLTLQDARGRARRGSLSLELSGAVRDLAALEGMNLRLKAGGKELAEIGPLVGVALPELGPFDFSAHLSGSVKAFSLADLTAVVDRSDFNGRAKLEIRKRPKITLVLESSMLDMTALMKNLEQEAKGSGRPPHNSETRAVFSNDSLPFDFFKQIDADISLKAKNVHTRDANFEFGELMLTLENGDLNIDTLQATYKQARISGTGHLYPESPPRVVANFLVQDFDFGGLLRELRLSEEVRSHLDIAVDVNSRGGSMHDLMANLNGSVGAVMGKGYLTRYLDLLSVGLSQKVYHFWGKHHKGGEIRCAVVQFDISQGTATSRAFVFDTEAGVLTGEGDINLATEQINFLLVPKPRYPSVMNFWTKLRVSGTIMDPKVRPDTLSLLSKGAKALSALVVGPLGLLAPFVNLGAHKAHPCSVPGIGEMTKSRHYDEISAD